MSKKNEQEFIEDDTPQPEDWNDEEPDIYNLPEDDQQWYE